MTKTRSLERELLVKESSNTMAPGDMCLLFMPKPLFEKLSEIATQRGMTLAQLMARALDTYLEAGEGVASGNAMDENLASFHFTPPSLQPTQATRPAAGSPRAALKGFR